MSDSLLDFILVEAAGLAVSPTAGAASVDLAASPLSAATAARVVGDDISVSQGTVSPLKSYSVVSVRGSDRDSLCMGVMSKTGRLGFCIRKNCVTKSHITKKFALSDEDSSFVFIVRVPGSNVFAEPCVKEELVPRAVLQEWRSTSTTLPNWVKAFRAVAVTDEVKMEAHDGEFKETKFLEDAESFRTPFKKRKDPDENQEGEEEEDDAVSRLNRNVKFLKHERGLPPGVDTAGLEALIADGSLGKGGLTRIVAEVETSVERLGDAMEEVATLTHNRFEDNEKESKAMLGVLQNLFATLGPAVEIDSNFEAPTLWGTTAFIAEDVVRLGGVVVSLQAELAPMLDSVNAVIAEQTKTAASSVSSDKVVQALSLVMDHVRRVGPELELLKKGLKVVEAELRCSTQGSPSRTTSASKVNEGSDPMDHLLTKMKRSVLLDDERRERDDIEDRRVSSPREERAAAMKLAAEVCRLVEDVEMLKAGAEDTSVKFGGLGVKSLHDCQAWILDNFKPERYGLLMDPLFMLERVFGSDSPEGNLLKILESRLKLNIATGAEAAVLNALSQARPRQFHNGKVAMITERNVSRLSKLPTYKSWNSAGQGVRNHVTKQMNFIRGTVSADIANTFGRGPFASAGAHALATMCLNGTVTFVTQLLSFVDTLYEKLHVDSRFSAAQSWSLTAQILDRICEELFAPKEGVLETMSINEPISVCSHIMWASLKTHDIMETYIESQFENHPTIAAEYVKFLATNSGHDKVDQLEAEVKAVDDRVDASLKASKAAGSKADIATGRCDTVKTLLEALAKRVEKLEKK
jgi:hypothetical protein